ncbi:MarR family winged helix-turn-helix transcriptional regulator [Pseudaquabacterium pictum]|nr:MarR family transcriptional regulator [Rubrivivax pictus]
MKREPLASRPLRATTAYIGHQLMGLAMRFRADCEHSLKHLDLLPREFGLLNEVVLHAGQTQAQIGQRLGIDRTTMVTMVDRLAAADWLERTPDPQDRRAYRLVATAKGLQLHLVAAEVMAAAEERLLNPLSTAKQFALRDMLACLAGMERSASAEGQHPTSGLTANRSGA